MKSKYSLFGFLNIVKYDIN